MRKCIIGMLALAWSGLLQAQTNFRELSFDEALQAAKQEGKMVFMDCYTSWCGPCKAMAKKEFPKKEMGDYLNPKFVCLKMDMEKGEGVNLGNRYDVNCYPTYLFLNDKGEVLFRMSAYMDVKRFIEETEKGLADTGNGVTAMMKRYRNGERSEEFVLEYLDVLRANMMRGEIQKVVSEYLLNKSLDDIIANKTYFKMFCDNIDQLDSPVFKKLYAEKDKLIAQYGKQADDKFYTVLKQYPYHFATYEGKEMTSFNLDKLAEYVSRLKSEKVKEASQIDAYYRYYVAANHKDSAAAYKYAKAYAKSEIRDEWEYYIMLGELKKNGCNVDSMVKNHVKDLEKKKKALDTSDERVVKRIDGEIKRFNELLSTAK